ncbi:MAG: CHAT domain-containing protein [Chitinophagaceae bacterium]
MKKFLLCCLIICLQLISDAQQLKDSSNNIYKIYSDQIADLLGVRGVPGEEIRELLSVFEKNKIVSDEDFAEILSKIYPNDKGIGILFYFFYNDSLHRIFFEPGIIKEKKIIPITKAALFQLGYDINYVIGLYAKAIKTMPSQRGIILEPPEKSNGADYPSVIKSATDLLIPESFNTKYKHLYIIPAMNIGTFPFSLLKPYKDDSLLIDKCSYTIVPSIIDLLGLRIKMLKNYTRWNGDLSKKFNDNYDFQFIPPASFVIENALFVSNPAYPENTEFIYPDLPGAEKEIIMAKEYAKNYKLLKGKYAIKDTVIHYLKKADVAYFATHGIADSFNPMEKSFLVLSGNDPFLTAKNIMELRNNEIIDNKFPEMVILSACQTGLGKAMEAGVAGLARSFLLAGSNHVIMSLWNVDDEATAFLMNRFIFHLQEKHNFIPSEPLRLAMLDARKKFSSPAQWASFAVFGIDF